MNRVCCGQNKLLKVHGIPMWSVPQLAWTCTMKVCNTKNTEIGIFYLHDNIFLLQPSSRGQGFLISGSFFREFCVCVCVCVCVCFLGGDKHQGNFGGISTSQNFDVLK